MKLTMLAKDHGSGSSGCPSIYLAENGDFVIQGRELDSATAGNLVNVLPGEKAGQVSEQEGGAGADAQRPGEVDPVPFPLTAVALGRKEVARDRITLWLASQRFASAGLRGRSYRHCAGQTPRALQRQSLRRQPRRFAHP